MWLVKCYFVIYFPCGFETWEKNIKNNTFCELCLYDKHFHQVKFVTEKNNNNCKYGPTWPTGSNTVTHTNG